MFVFQGLRISPEQWSSLLYGDTQHKSSMQSIIDKLSTPASFSQAIQEFLIVLQRAGDSSKHLSYLKSDFEYLSQIDFGNNEQQIVSNEDNSNWSLIVQVLQSIKTVLQSLIEFNWQETKTNIFNKNSHHHHHRSYDLSSTTFTSSTSCSSPMTVSPLGGSSTTSEYHLQPLHPPTTQHNQVKYKVHFMNNRTFEMRFWIQFMIEIFEWDVFFLFYRFSYICLGFNVS